MQSASSAVHKVIGKVSAASGGRVVSEHVAPVAGAAGPEDSDEFVRNRVHPPAMTMRAATIPKAIAICRIRGPAGAGGAGGAEVPAVIEASRARC